MPAADKDESLISHLEELRKTLIKCFASVVIMLFPCLWLSPKALDLFVKMLLKGNDITLNYFSPMSVFILQIKLALLMAVLLAFPYIAWNIWNFILPALYDKERKFLSRAVFLSSALFIGGVLFCAFIILPLIISFGLGFSSETVKPVFEINNVVSLSLWLSFVFGIMFQVPLITNMLIKWGIADRESISSKRPYVIVGLLIIAAVLTPPDIISQLLLFLPAYFLFELGLMLSRNEKKQPSARES